MKEAYAVRRTVPPSAEIQASIDRLLSKGMVDDPQRMLSELARLGARLIIQRAVEVDGRQDLLGAARALRGVQAPLALRRQAGGAVPGRDLVAGPPERPEGGRDLRLGVHRRRRSCAGGSALGDARGQGRLARARA